MPTVDQCFLESEIQDGQLRLMFSLCDGRLTDDAQVLLILKYLCGFGVREMAQAFLASEEATNKKLQRARAVVAASGALAEITDEARVKARLPAVCQALYLLFNEGYHGAHAESVVRADLCEEALRLGIVLSDHAITGQPEVHALVALMSLLLARLPARLDDRGGLVPLDEQDRARWDRALIARGFTSLALSARGTSISPYHLEASIAGRHAAAPRWEATDWAGIVDDYDRLLALRPTPVVALNRAISVAQRDGAQAGLAAIDAIPGLERLEDYPFLPAARADLLRRLGRLEEAAVHYRRALELARNEAERGFYESRLRSCAGSETSNRLPPPALGT